MHFHLVIVCYHRACPALSFTHHPKHWRAHVQTVHSFLHPPQQRRYPVGAPSAIIISDVTPRSRNKDPEYCLLSEELNQFQTKPQHISVFCRLGGPRTTGSAGALPSQGSYCYYLSLRSKYFNRHFFLLSKTVRLRTQFYARNKQDVKLRFCKSILIYALSVGYGKREVSEMNTFELIL
jgi:hypothetical protein